MKISESEKYENDFRLCVCCVLLPFLMVFSGCWMGEQSGEEEIQFNFMGADYGHQSDLFQDGQCEDHQDCVNGWACYEGECIDPERFELECSEDEDCPDDWFCLEEEYCVES